MEKVKTLRKHKGFTLIELIIVIVIIGLLAGLAVPKFDGIARDAQVATLMQDIDTLEKVIPVYYTKHEKYPLHIDNTITFKEENPLLLALKNNGESGKNLYKVDINRTKSYHSKLKYGYSGASDDYFIYSMDTGRVYYAKGVLNGNGLLVFGHDIQTKNTLRNLALSDIPVTSNQIMEFSYVEHTLSGEVLVNETVKVTHNGKSVPVEYEEMAYRSELTNIYTNSNEYKRFTSILNLDTTKPNKIEVSTSKETEIFTVMVNISSTEEIKQMIAAGMNHSIALMDNGTVWTWGYNFNGQLGNGTTENHSALVLVPFLSNVKQVAAGYRHSLALLEDGTVWAWGKNSYGELGDGTKERRVIPVRIQTLSDVKQVAAGNSHSLALLEDGSIQAWGWNAHGQLGDARYEYRARPIPVQNLPE